METDSQVRGFVDYRDGLLSGEFEVALLEFVGHYGFVDGFEETWAQGGVDMVGGIYYLFGDFVFGWQGTW